MEAFLKSLQKPPCCRPELCRVIPAQDLLQEFKINGREPAGRVDQLLQASDQRRPVESLDQSALGTCDLKKLRENTEWLAKKLAKCSQDTALRDIDDPVKRGVLVKEPGGGRSTSYSLANVG
jgi:Fic family protein